MKKISKKYWKEVLQEKFCEYIDCKNPIEKNKIYKDYLHETFLKLVEHEYKRYSDRIKFYSSDLKDNLKDDTLAFLIQHVQKYDTKRAAKNIEEKNIGYGLSYCATLVRAHMHDRLKKEHNKFRTLESFNIEKHES